jgi:hypothetical protein
MARDEKQTRIELINECHRSAWSKWSVILTDNPDAVHIGLTATPRIVVGGKKDADAMKKDEESYAFQCTGNPDLRPSADKLIPDFRGSNNDF